MQLDRGKSRSVGASGSGWIRGSAQGGISCHQQNEPRASIIQTHRRRQLMCTLRHRSRRSDDLPWRIIVWQPTTAFHGLGSKRGCSGKTGSWGIGPAPKIDQNHIVIASDHIAISAAYDLHASSSKWHVSFRKPKPNEAAYLMTSVAAVAPRHQR
jgi:hypothetical protein